jgi:hypothetical protein
LFCLGTLPQGVTDEQLWQARKVKESIIHPDFNKPIPAIGRMSMFAPANIPICTLLIWPTNNPAIIIGGQVINQTYNVICNYSNRSASGEMSNSLLAAGNNIFVKTIMIRTIIIMILILIVIIIYLFFSLFLLFPRCFGSCRTTIIVGCGC